MSNFRSIGQFSEQFKALSHPHGLALFHQRATCFAPGAFCHTEVSGRYGFGVVGAGNVTSPSTLSQHLREVNRADPFQMERKSKQVACWVEPKTLAQLAGLFGKIPALPDIRGVGP
jgi:ArsR family transcriptional regulator